MTTIKERIAKATEGKMPNCAANDALTELLNPTDEMIEAMVAQAEADIDANDREWEALERELNTDEELVVKERQLIGRYLAKTFTAAIQKALES